MWFPLLLFVSAFLWADGPAAFDQQLGKYLAVRKKASESVNPIGTKASAVEIANREASLANAIRKARADAKPGDIFTPEVRLMFAGKLKDAFKGTAGANRRENVKQGNPKAIHPEPGEVMPAVKVNAIYPTNASLSTVPPSLLMRLPQLPPELEYRFVGRALILRDRESNLIVDFLPEAVPAQ